MKIVTIIPLTKESFKGDLTYFTTREVALGNIVLASLRNRKILGLVVSCKDASMAKSEIKEMDFNLKKIIEVKEHSVLRDEFLESAFLISKYFATSANNVLSYLIPSILKENYDKVANLIDKSKESERTSSDERKKIRTEKLLFQAPLEDRLSSYKTLIRGSFAEKKSVFIVLPTENDIKNFAEILSKGIENFAFALHSGITPKKSLGILEKILKTDHPILVIGTAPFLFIPRNDFSTIILEHESSGAYKTVIKPNFDLRTFVELYATKANTKLILGDNLLRFETLARKELDELNPLHPMSYRVNFEKEIKVAGKGEKFEVIKEESINEIQKMLEEKKSVFIFALRKGLATMTVCKDCNNIISCDDCASPVVLYLSRDSKKRMFVCNRCHANISPESLCSLCESWNLMPLGIGTDTVYEAVKNLFPKTKVFQLDKENAKTNNGAEKIIKEFEEDKGSILIGTEMALFYIKNKIPLSIIASFDSLWNIPNFKISEKIVRLLLSIISKTKDKIIIQTKNEDDRAIEAIIKENLLSFIREELDDRKKLGYPPYKRFIKITHLGDKEEMSKAKELLQEIFKEYFPEIFSGFVPKLKGKYITNALIKVSPHKWSLPEISAGSSIDENLHTKLLSLPKEFGVFVDPEDLL